MYNSSTGACAAFLASWGTDDSTVLFQGQSYDLPAWSVSILPDCKSVVFNTAKVNNSHLFFPILNEMIVAKWKHLVTDVCRQIKSHFVYEEQHALIQEVIPYCVIFCMWVII